MKPRVYLETSFISYLAGRLSPDLVTLQRQLSSQRWWERNRWEFDLYISNEPQRGSLKTMATNQQSSAVQTSSWDLTMKPKDDIVDQIHAWREKYAAQFDYDLTRIFEDLKAKEAANPAPRAELKPVRPQAKRS